MGCGTCVKIIVFVANILFAENEEERDFRLSADRERHALSISSETFTQRNERLASQRTRTSAARSQENEEERDLRLSADRNRHALSRSSETFTQRNERLASQQTRTSAARSQLASLALVAVGVVVLLAVQDAVPIAVIVVGAVAFVISFLGCCGAIMDNKCMLFSYSILLIILMNLKTALATMIILSQDYIKKTLNTALQEQFDNNRDEFTNIEDMFGCCGTAGAGSYLSLTLPASCCEETNCTFLNAYPGCIPAADKFVQDFGYGIAAICILLVAIELIAVIFGLCLANRTNKYKGRY